MSTSFRLFDYTEPRYRMRGVSDKDLRRDATLDPPMNRPRERLNRYNKPTAQMLNRERLTKS